MTDYHQNAADRVDRWIQDVDRAIDKGRPPPAPVTEIAVWMLDGKSLNETCIFALLDEIATLRNRASEPARWAHTEWEWS